MHSFLQWVSIHISYVLTFCFIANLEIKRSENVMDKLDKDILLLQIDDLFCTYRFQSFFHVPDKNGMLKYLPDHPHFFTVQDVVDVHLPMMVEPAPVTTPFLGGLSKLLFLLSTKTRSRSSTFIISFFGPILVQCTLWWL